jgi:alkyl hydroperoxide reductase subunit AhpC
VSIMSDDCCSIRVGQSVPDFKLETFEQTKGDFGEFTLAGQKAARKWTVLFFYPADFTFV